MQFKHRAKITTSGGDAIGELSRVVIDPRTKEITHLVVSKGILFKVEKVMPVEMIADTSQDEIQLLHGEEALEVLPEYVETEYIMLDEHELQRTPYREGYQNPPVYWYPLPDARRVHSASFYDSPYVPTQQSPFGEEKRENIPENTVAFNQGAKVISEDGRHVGDVESVFTEPGSNVASHFVISKGIFLKDKKLIPVSWIREVKEEEVLLGVGSHLVENLTSYEGE